MLITAGDQLQFLHDNLSGIALDIVLVCPFTGLQLTFNVDL